MKVVNVVGARPQFIKAAPVSKALQNVGYQEILVHTGQHYDYEMSQIFFDELDIPRPHINLEVGSGSHGLQIGQMLIRLEEFLLTEKPDWVLVYGDTNSTLAGALAACKLRIPLAHVEAGLRSFNRDMPEEHNRVLVDHCSELLFCPTKSAVKNLAREGVTRGVEFVGDTMYDAILQFLEIAGQRSRILQDLNLQEKRYLLITIHRAYNTEGTENLLNILSALKEIDEPVVFPIHPRTKKKLAGLNGAFDSNGKAKNLNIIDPVSYLNMLVLEKNARMILTDSGGMQKEAYFLRVPCVTLRPETEWVETVETGWNILSGTEPENIIQAIEHDPLRDSSPAQLFGDGEAALKIVKLLRK